MQHRTTLDVFGATSRGHERAYNEDQFLIGRIARALHVDQTSVAGGVGGWTPENVEGHLLIVADGMGGQGGGEVAASTAVRTVASRLSCVTPWVERRPAPRDRQSTRPGLDERLRSALIDGDAAVQTASQHSGAPKAGTTLTAAYVCPPTLYIAHVGDSRCYLLRRGEIFRLTRDHTVAAQLREDGLDVNETSPWDHVLWNALGGGPNADTKPDVQRSSIMPGDALLLCSDGLTKHLEDTRIEEVLRANATAADACEVLVREANANGGTDNITVVVARSSS